MDIPFPPLPQRADPTKFVNNVPPSIKIEENVKPPPCTSEVCYPFSPQVPWSKDFFEVRAITLFLFYFIIFYYYYNSASENVSSRGLLISLFHIIIYHK